MEQVSVQTAQNVAIDYEVAGVGDRIIAGIIDYGLLVSYLLVVMLINVAIQSTAFVVLMALPAALYFLLCEVLLDGQSVGKQARRLRVVRLDGTSAGLGDYVLRWLLRPIDVTLTLGNVAIISLLVTGRGQRLGDLAAGTTVVRTRPRAVLDEVVPFSTAENDAPAIGDVDVLDERDIRLAREVLRALHDEGRTPSSERLAEDMKVVLERQLGTQSDLPAHRFIQAVLRGQ